MKPLRRELTVEPRQRNIKGNMLRVRLAYALMLLPWTLCLLAQPPMPVVAKNATAHKRPLASPKMLSIQPATIMRKSAAMAVSGPTATNYVTLGYDVPSEPSTNRPFVAFYSSSNMLDWRYLGRMEDVVGTNQVFTTTNTVPAMYYKANVIVRPVFFTNVTVSNSP